MCGIAVALSRDIGVSKDFCENALNLLAHRGPDAHGTWYDDSIGFAHTRLSIIDVSAAGAQPMISQNSRFVITYNGELYNHSELRKRFLPNLKFKGHSDTETILGLFELLGEKMLEHMIGMWSMAIWDTVEKKLFVSRDRYGQKPLYVRKNSNALLLSSEIEPLLQEGHAEVPNLLAISEYLGQGNYDHLYQDTFYRDIKQLLPGHYAYFDIHGEQILMKSYWEIEEVSYKDRLPMDSKLAQEFKELVFAAVESQLLSDVPVGATLSGGLDSSIIVSCIAAIGRSHFPVFTAQFEGSDYDETRYVKAMESKWGNAIEVCYAPVKELGLKESLPRVIAEQEEPFGDPSIMAHGFLVSAAKSAGIRVLLGGQGGDEISMGYSWMYQRMFAYALNKGDISSFIKFARIGNGGIGVVPRLVLAGIAPSIEHGLRMKVRRKQKQDLPDLLQLPSPPESFGKMDQLGGIYLESLRTVGLPHLCHYDDRSTMAQSIEGRMPFLDHRLMNFVSRLRPDAFYQDGASKIILRKAFSDILPAEILERRDKVGFYTPVEKLIWKDREWVLDLLKNASTLQWTTPNTRIRIMKQLANNSLGVTTASYIFRLISMIIWSNRHSARWI